KILDQWPNHLVVGEEGGGYGSRQSPYKWYVDPLDGTTNFAHGHPFFAVSIGLFGPDDSGEDRPLVGVVNAPALGELYWGSYGGGAHRRLHIPGRGFTEHQLAVTETATLRNALLNTGFPYDIYEREGEILHPFGRLITLAQSVRRAGCASLDMAYVAAGIADGFWESSLKPWDVAAGLVLLSEAGGIATDYDGQSYRLGHSLNILGANRGLHAEILKFLK
ncbi:MAG: inositol monophosphatase family protein, partial [Candidatus Adiutrix sp.]